MVDFSQVRPGSRADIVIEIDYKNEKIDVRRSLIYDVIEENIILAQTNPPVTSHYVDTKVIVSYLVREDNEQVRYGVVCTVSEIIRDYQLVSSEKVSAFSVKKKASPVKFNVRMHFRVRPGIHSGISLALAGEKMNIIDISIGGAKVTHHKNLNIDVNTRTNCILTIDGEEFPVDAMILRTWRTAPSKRTYPIEYLAMQFLNINVGLENKLSKKIREIERESRLKELGMDSRDVRD